MERREALYLEPLVYIQNQNAQDNEKINNALLDAKRVLVLQKVEDIVNGEIIGEPELVATIILEDEIRESTKKFFDYFKSQEVEIKIISGDNHVSVAQIAKRAGLDETSKAIDASKLTDEELKEAISIYSFWQSFA